jgi:hypothetical protein
VHVNEREGRGLFDNSFIVNDEKFLDFLQILMNVLTPFRHPTP